MEKRFKCDCFTHELNLWIDDDTKDAIDHVEVCMWSCGNEVGSGWGFRLRLIWQVLTLGHGYKDMVCLKSYEARKMGQTLIEMADELEDRKRNNHELKKLLDNLSGR